MPMKKRPKKTWKWPSCTVKCSISHKLTMGVLSAAFDKAMALSTSSNTRCELESISRIPTGQNPLC